ncbi:MAG: cytochrome c maturation protein CcmE [bacterium]|nr:cytochrome c maturation protein CcmE [bacterium]
MSDPRRQRRLWYIIGGVLIVAFLGYGATSFKSNLTPYVSFEEAQRRSGKVQVAGGLVTGSSQYLEEDQVLSFAIEDEDGTLLDVVYAGVKPGNFEEATQIVAVGIYRDGTFEADQLLVKCPSKYQGLEEA